MSEPEDNRPEPVVSATGPQPVKIDISALLHGRVDPPNPFGDLARARRAASDAEHALRACLGARFAELDACGYALMLLDGRDKDVAQLYSALVEARAELQRCYAAAPGEE
jgi:hypothetical protein